MDCEWNDSRSTKEAKLQGRERLHYFFIPSVEQGSPVAKPQCGSSEASVSGSDGPFDRWTALAMHEKNSVEMVRISTSYDESDACCISGK